MAKQGDYHEYVMSKEEFEKPITDGYVKNLAEMPIEQLIDDYNPGPTNPDGTVNFECHCVAHLVASPCGHEFRQAISCQKAAEDDEMKNGECADKFIQFMQCAVRTQCFRPSGQDPEEEEK
ncbi:unnamed protein product [Bursaphelenchus xylophilus]|uniref:(pine wood nematode) hypothetical protein n=1 Tax=Bursaphelenchus xylophilus TaxID=6326 RepID=A0A7I8X0B9_BURXY|nr:unnamed protein product [Bursaphelenchus xylophilus]CAG9129777.1 unnamed protein product [Bursaphelenchus xylophilus]